MIEPHNLAGSCFFQVRVLRGETNLYFGDAGELPQRSSHPRTGRCIAFTRSKTGCLRDQAGRIWSRSTTRTEKRHNNRQSPTSMVVWRAFGTLSQSIVSKDCIEESGSHATGP